MKITIDITDEARIAIDRLANLVERLERVTSMKSIKLSRVPPDVSESLEAAEAMPGPPEKYADEPASCPEAAEHAADKANSTWFTTATGSSSDSLGGFETIDVCPSFKDGRGAEEKVAIWQRMRDYRKARGLGCWKALGDKLGRSDEWIRSVYAKELAVPVEEWRKIGRAIDQLEGCNGAGR